VKLQNKFYVIIVITAMLLATLAGCAESGNNNTATLQVDESLADVLDDAPDKETDSGFQFCVETLVIMGVDDYRSELLKHFELSRTVGKEDEDYWVYSDNKIANIKEFYFPTMEIDGYALYNVIVSEYKISYFFVLIELFNDVLPSCISISIDRSSSIRDIEFEHPFEAKIAYSKEHGWSYLTEDNMLYKDRGGWGGYGSITAPIGDTVFTISVPSYPTNDAFVRVDEYEVSRELALRFIETAELITVG